MADLTGKLEMEVDDLASGDLFHQLWRDSPHEICNIHPEFLQSYDVHEGEFGKPGSIVVLNYNMGGKIYTAKDRLEIIDDVNKITKWVVLEGDIMQDYKSFTLTSQVLTKGEGMHTVKWTFEYEKLHEGVADPHAIMDELIKLTKKIEDHHLQA